MNRLPSIVRQHIAALRGVRYRPASAQSMLRRNLVIYGIGGLIIPFIGIWAIDLIVQLIPGFGK